MYASVSFALSDESSGASVGNDLEVGGATGVCDAVHQNLGATDVAAQVGLRRRGTVCRSPPPREEA